MEKGKIVSATIIAAIAMLAAFLFSTNGQLKAELQASQNYQAELLEQQRILEANLNSAQLQLQRLSAALQMAREDRQERPALRTSNDLSSQLHGAQPPSTSVAPPPGYQGSRPPGTSVNMARQMAEMQATVRYGEFIAELTLGAQQENQLRTEIIDVFTERVEASQLRASGRGGDIDAAYLASTEYLRERISSTLDDAQLEQFDAYEANFQQRQQRLTFSQEIMRYAPDLNAGNQTLVLDTVLNHLGGTRAEAVNPQTNAVSETQRQLMAVTAARMELMQKLSPPQMQEADKFLNQVRSGMVQSQTMNEGNSN